MADFVPVSAMENYRSMLEELFDVESGLSNKEIDFLDSINEWDGQFTVPQAEWLQKIYDKAF